MVIGDSDAAEVVAVVVVVAEVPSVLPEMPPGFSDFFAPASFDGPIGPWGQAALTSFSTRRHGRARPSYTWYDANAQLQGADMEKLLSTT